MFHRRIESLTTFLWHLRFQEHVATAPVQPILLRDLFALRFKHYLAGCGHPQWLLDHGLIDDNEMQRGLTTPFLRPHLLLLAALEAPLLPVDDDWDITVRIAQLFWPS